jgi:hypothetical protein
MRRWLDTGRRKIFARGSERLTVGPEALLFIFVSVWCGVSAGGPHRRWPERQPLAGGDRRDCHPHRMSISPSRATSRRPKSPSEPRSPVALSETGNLLDDCFPCVLFDFAAPPRAPWPWSKVPACSCPRCRTPTEITTKEHRQTSAHCNGRNIATLCAILPIYCRASSGFAAPSPNCALPVFAYASPPSTPFPYLQPLRPSCA